MRPGQCSGAACANPAENCLKPRTVAVCRPVFQAFSKNMRQVFDFISASAAIICPIWAT